MKKKHFKKIIIKLTLCEQNSQSVKKKKKRFFYNDSDLVADLYCEGQALLSHKIQEPIVSRYANSEEAGCLKLSNLHIHRIWIPR